MFFQPRVILGALRTDSPQTEMVSRANTPKQREGLGDPSKALSANMINALEIDEMDNIEQRNLDCFRALGAVVSVNLRVVCLDK